MRATGSKDGASVRRRAVPRPDIVPPALDLYTIPETAAILDVSPRLVSLWIKAGALMALRLGPGQRLLRIRRCDLEAFVATQQPRSSTANGAAGGETGMGGGG